MLGYGYWGPNLARNFVSADGARVVAICDERAESRELAASRHPNAEIVTDAADVVASPDVDAIAIATPVASHADLAVRALQAGKHVLVEKPFARNASEALRMIDAAAASGRTLMVDHTFVYTGAVRKVRDLILSAELGDLFFVDSVRVNLGLFRQDASVLWDLAVHDLSILSLWIDPDPIAVSCVGVSHVEGMPDDIAYLTLYYPGALIGHVHVSWLSPIKIRRMLIAGSEKTVVFDDLSVDEKLKLYSRGVTRENQVVGADLIPLAYRRTGDIWIPQIDQTEGLRVMADHFIECCRTGRAPETGGAEGLQVVRLLEAAERSAREGGRRIDLVAEVA